MQTGVSKSQWITNSSRWTRTFFHNKMLLKVPPFSVWPVIELKMVDLELGKQPLMGTVDDSFVFSNAYFTAKLNKVYFALKNFSNNLWRFAVA